MNVPVRGEAVCGSQTDGNRCTSEGREEPGDEQATRAAAELRAALESPPGGKCVHLTRLCAGFCVILSRVHMKSERRRGGEVERWSGGEVEG